MPNEPKVILVTGGASGIGAACTELLAANGACVVLTDINKGDGTLLADQLAAKNRKVLFLSHDVQEESDWQSVMEEVQKRYGKLDVLVNNAGIIVTGNPESTTLAQFHQACAVMAGGTYLGCKYAIPLMREAGGGSIINMASAATHIGSPELLAYSAAKGAVRSMTKVIAVYCQSKGYNIRCNSIHPGAVKTPMAGRFENMNAGQKVSDIPAEPGEVAALVAYLASDEAKFMNGAEIVFDNAMSVK